MKGKKEKESISRLLELTGDKYPEYKTNVAYKHGEIDFMGKRKDGRWDIYEIKSTNRPRMIEKAREQLERAQKRYLSASKTGDSFVFVSNDDIILSV